MCTHPKWNGRIREGFDIAMAKLSTPVENATCPILFQGNDGIGHGTQVLALGWGIFDDRADGEVRMKAASAVRMADYLKWLSHEHCQGEVKKYLKPHTICAYARNQNVCKGECIHV